MARGEKVGQSAGGNYQVSEREREHLSARNVAVRLHEREDKIISVVDLICLSHRHLEDLGCSYSACRDGEETANDREEATKRSW